MTDATHDRASRPLDLVVFGATGFTGQLVARYLAASAELKGRPWAIAGRSREKLEAVKAELVALDSSLTDLEIILASSDDRGSLVAMTARTRAVITLVGPYARYGSLLVEACIETGTDYCDLTGEPAWWQEMIDRHHDAAVEAGVLLVPCCGFDSIPYDLGVHFTLKHLPGEEPATVRGYMASKAQFSGGTWASAVNAMANMREDKRAASTRRPRTSGEGRGRDHGGGGAKPRGMHWSREVSRWAVPLPTIDPLVVRRTGTLGARGQRSVRYHHYLQLKSLGQGISLGAAVSGMYLLSQTSWTRGMLERYRPSGAGPTPEVRARSWFKVELFGESGEARVVAEVRGGDPGYDETAKMISECGLALAYDRASLPASGGLSTPAAAFGDVLLDRLVAAGIEFRLVEATGAGAAD